MIGQLFIGFNYYFFGENIQLKIFHLHFLYHVIRAELTCLKIELWAWKLGRETVVFAPKYILSLTTYYCLFLFWIRGTDPECFSIHNHMILIHGIYVYVRILHRYIVFTESICRDVFWLCSLSNLSFMIFQLYFVFNKSKLDPWKFTIVEGIVLTVQRREISTITSDFHLSDLLPFTIAFVKLKFLFSII